MDTPASTPAGPLAGLKVIELGQLIAGPFAAKTLADFGADVIKVEPPGTGDPLRKWRLLKDGTSVWWQVQSRNKRSLALDLKDPEAQAVVRQLALQADVLIENFRPGAMESFDLDPEALMAANPRLIVLRISGYGQTGPYRDKPGFGVVAEAMGGLRHLSGEPGRTPVRVGVSIGDTLAALHGVIGILMAVNERHRSGRGQVIDVALYEAVFNCMESLLPEYSAFGAVRGPAGSALPGIAPSNAYACTDGHALVAGNGDSIFKRLMKVIGRADLGQLTRHWPTTPAASRRSIASMPPSAPGRPRARSRRCSPRSTPPVCRLAASTPRPTSRTTRTTRRAACCSRCRWTTAARSPCPASCPSCRARRAATGATPRRSGRTTRRCWPSCRSRPGARHEHSSVLQRGRHP